MKSLSWFICYRKVSRRVVVYGRFELIGTSPGLIKLWDVDWLSYLLQDFEYPTDSVRQVEFGVSDQLYPSLRSLSSPVLSWSTELN